MRLYKLDGMSTGFVFTVAMHQISALSVLIISNYLNLSRLVKIPSWYFLQKRVDNPFAIFICLESLRCLFQAFIQVKLNFK